jgi:alkylated DNA repair dioxygenase AlkB
MIIYQDNDAALLLFDRVFSSSDFDIIQREVDWRQNQIRLFGKWHLEPRLTAWFGKPYTYSNIHWEEQKWIAPLEQMREKINMLYPFPFNSVLANYYRTGQDSMGWHSDDEPEMNQACIASVSLGASRVMQFRNIISKEKLSITLHNGSLLIMQHFQRDWQHAIPKTARAIGPRINLTFREIKS